jgi:RNA polymerase sigma-70 factor (ECF subfamily)
MVPSTDTELAARVAHRDRAALDEVFNSLGGAVRSVAARVLRDDALAEDVAQETFLRFWNEPEKYDPERGSLRTFLLTIAHRRAVDVVRSEVARSRREERPPDPHHYDVAEEAWTRVLSGTVRQALDELPEGEREAITLAYLGGLTYVEVAEHLGQPEGTVKSRIRSGMRKLSVLLAEVHKG